MEILVVVLAVLAVVIAWVAWRGSRPVDMGRIDAERLYELTNREQRN